LITKSAVQSQASKNDSIKHSPMKTRKQINNRSGFTLIEMVGVLAVIAILAALLVPKIFAAINDSRYSSAVSSINSVKAASMSYFAKNKGLRYEHHGLRPSFGYR
jgi:prepilin-type N-terminal cleavage/methylation domain-containing protein